MNKKYLVIEKNRYTFVRTGHRYLPTTKNSYISARISKLKKNLCGQGKYRYFIIPKFRFSFIVHITLQYFLIGSRIILLCDLLYILVTF